MLLLPLLLPWLLLPLLLLLLLFMLLPWLLLVWLLLVSWGVNHWRRLLQLRLRRQQRHTRGCVCVCGLLSLLVLRRFQRFMLHGGRPMHNTPHKPVQA